MEYGQLSYAKVRALTRVATSENESALLNVALAGTAAQVERFVRAWRRVDRAAEGRDDERRFLKRELATWVDDDGMVVIRGRLTPEVGALVQRALEAAADRLFREARPVSTGNSLTEDVTPAQRRADALGLLAECALSADLDRGAAGDRYQVVVHVDAATERDLSQEGPSVSITNGVIEVDHGALHVSAETSRRISCDAAVVTMRLRHGPGGEMLDVGRRTRAVPSAIRRALDARDRGCRFPGCTSRRCDAHHLEHSTPARKPRAPGAPAGRMAASRASGTWCCSAGAIIARCTKVASAWQQGKVGRSCSGAQKEIAWKPRRRQASGTSQQ